MTVALLFPGQGAVAGGQAATLELGLAGIEEAGRRGLVPGIVAGHSVGAFSAAVAAGVLDPGEARAVVALRERAMVEADGGRFAMAACDGLGEAAARRVVDAAVAAGECAWPAAVNAADQTALAVHRDDLAAVGARAIAAGARALRPLAIGTGSHGPAFDGVARALATALADVPPRPLRAIYVGTVRARPLRTSAAVLGDLAEGVARTVRWHDAVTLAVELGATHLVQAPPGRVLADLARRDPQLATAGVVVTSLG